VQTNIAKSTTVQAGILDALTINDPEQLNSAPGTSDKLNGLVSVQHAKGDDTVRATVLAGERGAYSSTVAGVTATSPETMRQYLVVDWQRKSFLDPKLSLFLEGVAGRDRVGNDVAAANRVDHPLWGFDAMLSYQLNPENSIVGRLQQFDQNRDVAGDQFRSIGAGYIFKVSPTSKIHLLQEVFVDGARANQKRYNLTTIRFGTKF
jgi:hypothetical protein